MSAYLENTDSRVFLVDASIYIFRAWYIYPDTITDTQGRPINALYGFLYFLSDLLTRANPRHIAIAFDGSSKHSFRKALYSAYKANRDPTPEELRYQFGLCFDVAEQLGFRCMKSLYYEADDLIATMAERYKQMDYGVTVVSADKDLAQVMSDEHDFLWDFARDEVYDARRIEDKFGVLPDKIPDLLALAGDKVDNIPGINGVGVKTAARLLSRCAGLEDLLARCETIDLGKIRNAARISQSINEERELIRLYYKLTELVRNADIEEAASCEWRCPGAESLDSILAEFQVDNILRSRFSRFATSVA